MPDQPSDPTAESRKSDHITLAFQSQIRDLDPRFYYEPLFAAHPSAQTLQPFSFLGKMQRVPIWVSSMTGGTAKARIINRNLARACGQFGMGMGLGSCRQLLHDDAFLEDFNVRPLMGDEVPFFANLGIAQLEQLIEQKALWLVTRLLEKLRADGLIIHVNPMQEWLQPEGDRFQRPPLETIEMVLAALDCPIIVKEVGQGFGYKSLEALFQLPLAAIDFGAAGGTNFAKLELLRADDAVQKTYNALARIGHTADEMVTMSNQIIATLGDRVRCKEVIISGGVQDFLDGYYLTQKLQTRSVYGQASALLRHAQGDYAELETFLTAQIKGLAVANAYLQVRH